MECEDGVAPIEKLEPEVVWSYDLHSGSIFNDDVMPVIDNGYTYIAAVGTLRCVELKTGKVKWVRELGIDTNLVIESNKLLDSENTLFLNHSNWVKAFNKNDGSLKWETFIDNFDNIDLAIMSQNSNSLLLGGQAEVIKLNKLSGVIELRIDVEDPNLMNPNIMNGYHQLAYNVVISDYDDFIYVPTGYFTGKKLGGYILCYDAITGKYLWSYSSDDDLLTCDINETKLACAGGSTVILLDRFTGEELWKNNIPDDGFYDSIVLNKNSVYMGSTAQSFMYCFDLETGKLKWKSEDTPNSIFTIPTVIEDRIYFCNWAYIYVLNTSTGKTLWKSMPPEYYETYGGNYSYISPVAVGEGYMVCVGNKKAYCLTDPWY